MNLLLLDDSDFCGPAKARIGGRRAIHLIEVLRVSRQSTVEVGVVDGALGAATVLEVSEGEVVLEVVLDRQPPPRLNVSLILALPRPRFLHQILHCCATMGVESLYLVHTKRVQKDYWGSRLLVPEAMRGEMMLGLEQGRDTRLPDVHLRRRFKPFVEDELPAIAAGRVSLIGDLEAKTACPSAVVDPLALFIGPEGGLLDYEVGQLAELGFQSVHLGPRPLTVVQAVPAFLGRLSTLRSRT